MDKRQDILSECIKTALRASKETGAPIDRLLAELLDRMLPKDAPEEEPDERLEVTR